MLELRSMVYQPLRFDIFRVFQIFRSSSEKFNIWRSTSVPEELQAFATDTGLADGVLLPHRPLELVWQAAKVKQFLGVSLNVLQLVDVFFFSEVFAHWPFP